MTRPRRRQKRERKEGSDDDHDQGPDSKKSVSSAEESEDKSDSNIIMKLPNIVRATVINRPSKVVRSPYMADIVVEGWKDYKTPGQVQSLLFQGFLARFSVTPQHWAVLV